MAFDTQSQIIRSHARAIVGDADQVSATARDYHLDLGGTGIQRVFDQFLDGRGRTLDHLARRDTVDQYGIQSSDAHRSEPFIALQPDRTAHHDSQQVARDIKPLGGAHRIVKRDGGDQTIALVEIGAAQPMRLDMHQLASQLG